MYNMCCQKLDRIQCKTGSEFKKEWSEFWVVICSRNRVPGPGSKIHYPVPNPGN